MPQRCITNHRTQPTHSHSLRAWISEPQEDIAVNIHLGISSQLPSWATDGALEFGERSWISTEDIIIRDGCFVIGLNRIACHRLKRLICTGTWYWKMIEEISSTLNIKHFLECDRCAGGYRITGNELSKDLKAFGSETLLKCKNVRAAKWVSELAWEGNWTVRVCPFSDPQVFSIPPPGCCP